MAYKRILSIQDISCFGQCSLTVALPILSAAGHETCILPSAILSTHTGGFTGYTFRDLTADIPLITAHWKKENIKFDAVYTGYLGSIKQIGYIKNIIKDFYTPGFKSFVDPVMGDNGKIYGAFDDAFVNEMKTLVFNADVIMPNVTEACLLTGEKYQSSYDEKYIETLIKRLKDSGAKDIILTGVSYDDNTTGVIVSENTGIRYYRHKKIYKNSHGTGDVYASAYIGAYLRGKSTYESAKIAADYTVLCIEETITDDTHWYGVKFEPLLPEYMTMLSEGKQ